MVGTQIVSGVRESTPDEVDGSLRIVPILEASFWEEELMKKVKND